MPSLLDRFWDPMSERTQFPVLELTVPINPPLAVADIHSWCAAVHCRIQPGCDCIFAFSVLDGLSILRTTLVFGCLRLRLAGIVLPASPTLADEHVINKPARGRVDPAICALSRGWLFLSWQTVYWWDSRALSGTWLRCLSRNLCWVQAWQMWTLGSGCFRRHGRAAL